MEKSDTQLVAEYIAGDGTAFEMIVRRYIGPVYNFSYRMSGDSHDAEDIVQDTFVKVWKHIRKYHPDKKFSSWLFAIARNTAIDILRKKKHLAFSDFEDDKGYNHMNDILTDQDMLPDERSIHTEDISALNKAMDSLSYIYKEILMLYYSADMTFEEIGTAIGVSVNTAKSRHRRALIALREMMHQNHSV